MKVENLCYQHHKNAPLFFENLSFSLELGKIHALHGKNGSGKSLLLNILTNKIEKEAVLNGTILAPDCLLMNQRFDHLIADQFTFLENLRFAAMRKKASPFKTLKEVSCSQEFVNRFKIDMTIPTYRLSGGQRQILALLMQLQKGSKSLALDEPTSAMDEQNANTVFEFLKTLTDVTILIVCHDKELLSRYTTGTNLTLTIDDKGIRRIKDEG